MAEKQSFEAKVARLEQIVAELEGGKVELDKAIQLFKEGKALSRECEALLKTAQVQIDRAMNGAPEAAAEASDDEIPF